jgi:hypothetical protein
VAGLQDYRLGAKGFGGQEMTDAEILEIIADGIVDGTDMDCTTADQARAVLKALRDAGVFEEEYLRGIRRAAIAVSRLPAVNRHDAMRAILALEAPQ